MSDTPPTDKTSSNDTSSKEDVIEAEVISDSAESGEAEAKSAPETTPSAETAPGSGGGSRLIVGLSLGVAVASVVVLGLAYQGLISFGGDSGGDMDALNERLAALETSTENAEAAQVQAVNELRTHLASLDARVQAAAARGGEADTVDTAAFEAEVAALKEQLTQLETRPAPETTVSETELVAARQDIENMQRALQGVFSHVETVDRGLAKTDLRLEALEQNAPPDNLDDILSSLSAKSDVDALRTRLAGLEKFNSIEATEKATIALAAADLAEASKGSAPFVTELDAFNIVAPGNATARELRAYAVSGTATENVLTKQYSALMRKAIKEEKLADADNLAARSWASFKTTFDVRRVGEVEGLTTKAILSRAEVRVEAGDLDAAARELDGLDGAAKTVMADWVHDVRARTRLNGLMTKLSAAVLSDLNATLEAAGEK